MSRLNSPAAVPTETAFCLFTPPATQPVTQTSGAYPLRPLFEHSCKYIFFSSHFLLNFFFFFFNSSICTSVAGYWYLSAGTTETPNNLVDTPSIPLVRV